MQALNVYTICLDGDINITAQAGNIDGFEAASADAVTVTPAPQIVKGKFPVQSTENFIASAQ
jgi:hypothetical protein